MMRPQNKSRSRNKNNSNNNNNNNNRRHMGNIVNRVFDSAGPEGKVRGTPQQIIEKYQSLARDAQLSNDRVAAENFLQHAEHYSRMLGEALSQQAEMRQVNDGQPTDRQNGMDNEDSSESHSPTYQPHQNYGQHDTSASRYESVQQPSVENEQPQPAMAAFTTSEETETGGLVPTPENRPAGRGRSRGGQGRQKQVAETAAIEPSGENNANDA